MIPIDFLQGSFLLLARDSAGVQVFDVQTLQQVNFLQASSNLNGPVVALSPDGRMVAWAFEDGTIQSIRLLDQTVLFTINSGQISPIKLKFSPKGGKLFSVSPDGSIKVWDDQGILENTFQPGGELVNFGISPDGTILATIPSDGPVTLWNLDDFHKIIELGGSGGYDTSEIAFSPNGKYLAADLATGLYLWRVQDGNELLSAKDSINSLAVAYSPDGRFLAYSDQNDIILSSPDSSQIIRTLTGHLLPVFELLFSPDGSQLISADDTQTYVWRVEDGKLLAIGKNKCP